MMSADPRRRIAGPLELCVLHESASASPSDTSAFLTRNHLALELANTRMRRGDGDGRGEGGKGV